MFGGKQLTDEVMRRYGLSYEEAGLAKRQGGLPESYEIEVLEPFKEAMVQQISRLLQFFFAGSEYTKVDQVVLAGGCASISGIAEMVEEQLGVPAIVANPLAGMALSPRVQAQTLQQDAPALDDRLRAGAAELRLNGQDQPTSVARRAPQTAQPRVPDPVGLARHRLRRGAGGAADVFQSAPDRRPAGAQRYAGGRDRQRRPQDQGDPGLREDAHESLLSRKQVIEELQANRSLMVHLFDDLVRTIPEGVRLNSIKQNGDQLTLRRGRVQCARLEYMRNLETSDWMSDPDLQIVEAKGADKRSRYVVHAARQPEEAEGRG